MSIPGMNSFQIAPETDDEVSTWVRFRHNGEMEIWWDEPDSYVRIVQLTLCEESLRGLTRVLVKRFPLEALSSI